ncbi:MAG: tetratricopeptide repeat protein [Betaproteobacteria bacterium]
MMHRLLRFLAIILCVCGMPAYAQDGRDLSEEARKLYSAGLKEAGTLIKDRQFATASSRLDALIVQRPREPQARFLKGVVETEQGHVDVAIATFRALIEDYPELPEPYNNLAVLYAQRGDYGSARVALETAVRTAPNWAVARENLGDIYARLAADEYERAAKLDRDNKSAPAKLTLVRSLLAAGVPAKPKS